MFGSFVFFFPLICVCLGNFFVYCCFVPFCTLSRGGLSNPERKELHDVLL